MIDNILKIDGIENNIVNHTLKKECGYKYTSIIANYKFETIVYNQCKTFNSKVEYDGDYKIKSTVYKKIKSKYKKITIKEFFNNNEIVEKLIQLAIFKSLQYNLADYAKNTFKSYNHGFNGPTQRFYMNDKPLTEPRNATYKQQYQSDHARDW